MDESKDKKKNRRRGIPTRIARVNEERERGGGGEREGKKGVAGKLKRAPVGNSGRVFSGAREIYRARRTRR